MILLHGDGLAHDVEEHHRVENPSDADCGGGLEFCPGSVRHLGLLSLLRYCFELETCGHFQAVLGGVRTSANGHTLG